MIMDRRDIRPAQPLSEAGGAEPLQGHSADEIGALELVELAVGSCVHCHGIPSRSVAVREALATLVDIIAQEVEHHG